MSAGIQTGEVKCGGRRVFWGPAGSETELGLTDEGSVLVIEQFQAEIRAAEYGQGLIKKIHDGDAVRAELVLKQWDDTQLALCIPTSATGTGNSVWGGRIAGIDLSATDYAKRLRLHPITTTNTATEDDNIYIHLAIPRPAPIQARFIAREPAMIAVVFDGIIDTTQTDGQRLYRIRQS